MTFFVAMRINKSTKQLHAIMCNYVQTHSCIFLKICTSLKLKRSRVHIFFICMLQLKTQMWQIRFFENNQVIYKNYLGLRFYPFLENSYSLLVRRI